MGGAQLTDGAGNVTYVCDGATGATGPAGPAGTTGQSATTSFGNAALASNSMNSFIPGLGQMVTVPAHARVLVQSTGGMQTSATAVGGFSIVEFGLYDTFNLVTTLESGTRRRLTAANVTTTERGYAYWSISEVLLLPAGTHMINVAAFQPSVAGNASATVSGIDGSLLQATLTITILNE